MTKTGQLPDAVPLPPREIQLWVGKFERDEDFIDTGRRTVRLMVELAGLAPDRAVLDVGCGCGRVARALTEYLSPAGRCFGFDVGEEPITWCQEHITSRFPAFVFAHVDVHNAVYHPDGAIGPEEFRFPCANASFDLVLLESVFTHMLPPGAEHYAREAARVLRPGGHLLASHHLMDDAAQEAVTAGTTVFEFRHPLGPATTLDAKEPQVGLAYDPDYAERMLTDAGLRVTARRRGNWREVHEYCVSQDWLCAVKAS
jgi:SAM-dependent methyltransferase